MMARAQATTDRRPKATACRLAVLRERPSADIDAAEVWNHCWPKILPRVLGARANRSTPNDPFPDSLPSKLRTRGRMSVTGRFAHRAPLLIASDRDGPACIGFFGISPLLSDAAVSRGPHLARQFSVPSHSKRDALSYRIRTGPMTARATW